MKKVFQLILFFSAFMLVWCWSEISDTWQGAYYKWWLDDSNIIWWPVFNNYDACKDWALSMQQQAAYGYAWCSKNCHDTKAWIPQCEDVVRTWRPLPNTKVFEWMTEDQLGPERVCEEPKNTFWIWTDMYEWYQYAENGWDCNDLWNTDMRLWCSYYFYAIIEYLWCVNQCDSTLWEDAYFECALSWLWNDNEKTGFIENIPDEAFLAD